MQHTENPSVDAQVSVDSRACPCLLGRRRQQSMGFSDVVYILDSQRRISKHSLKRTYISVLYILRQTQKDAI